jgi:hypothetical protein
VYISEDRAGRKILAKSWASLSLATPSGCRNSPPPPSHPRSTAGGAASSQRLWIHLPRSAPPLGISSRRCPLETFLPSPRWPAPGATVRSAARVWALVASSRTWLTALALLLGCLGRQLPSRNPSRRWDLCRRPTTTSWCPCALLPPAPPTRQPVLHSSALQVHTQHLLHSSALQVSSLWCCNLPLLVMPILTEHLPLSVMPILTKHLPLPVMPILTEHFYCTVCELNTIPIWEFEM